MSGRGSGGVGGCCLLACPAAGAGVGVTKVCAADAPPAPAQERTRTDLLPYLTAIVEACAKESVTDEMMFHLCEALGGFAEFVAPSSTTQAKAKREKAKSEAKDQAAAPLSTPSVHTLS